MVDVLDLRAAADTHMVAAFNACGDALDFLRILDLALADGVGAPEVAAACTVLGHVSDLVLSAKGSAESARRALAPPPERPRDAN